MQVKKQDINIGKAVFLGDIKTGAEGSIIVPDVKPDILKVLQVDAETFLTEKVIENGKIILKGKVKINLLYLPEADDTCVQCITGYFEFCETIKRNEFEENMQLIAFCDAEKVTYKLINSRKIGIDAKIVISVQVMSLGNCTVIADVEEDVCETKKDTIKISKGSEYKEFCVTLDEAVSVPAGKSQPLEILKNSICVIEKEYKTLSEKLVVKGRAIASVLYLSENNRCDYMEFELPFTEVFDMEGIGDDSVCDITYQVGETEFTLSEGQDGKVITVNANVLVSVKCEKCDEVLILKDCYFINKDAELSWTEIETEEITARPSLSVVQKELLRCEEAGEIAGVYNVVAKPVIISSELQNGRISVSGKTAVFVLYITDNDKVPVCSLSEEIPFSYMIDAPGAERNQEVYLNIECEHISSNITSGGAEVRCGLGISGKIVKKKKIKAICEIETTELPKPESGMVIYFVKKGDTIWDIGKNYHITCKKILEANALSEEAELIAGEKLIIPISNKV